MSLFCETHFAPEYSRESGYSHSIRKDRFEMSKTPIWLSNPNKLVKRRMLERKERSARNLFQRRACPFALNAASHVGFVASRCSIVK